jgi:pyruvate kinase
MMPRRTKIVATLGPASESPDVLAAMIAAGLDVARLNLSHGEPDEHLKRLAAVRVAATEAGRVVGVLADLPGPKVRSGPFPASGTFLREGTHVKLFVGTGACDDTHIAVEYATLLSDLRVGDRVILGDGAITLVVTEVDEHEAEAVVITGGRVQGRPGIHLPAERLRLTAPTDLELLAVMADHVDFVGVSFVRTASDLRRVRSAVASGGPMIIAKIETTAAVFHLAEILDAADGVMVARGDLGIESPLEDVPHLQKMIIRSAVEAGRPVITATQMLESMVNSPTPTRAEVSDVANAVFDGTDAVMLSAETAIGHDPALVVSTMARIAERAESEADYARWATGLGRRQRQPGGIGITEAIAHAAWHAASDAGAAAVLCCSRSGHTARAMVRFRPEGLLIGLSPNERTVGQLTLSWGVRPLKVETYRSTDELVWCAVEAAVRAGLVHHGEIVAVLAGAPDRAQAATDVLRLVRVD